MAITNVTELRQAILDWLDRPDLSAFVNDFIALSEGYFMDPPEDAATGMRADPLRVREMETRVVVTNNGDSTFTLPTDYKGTIHVTALTNPVTPLVSRSPRGGDQLHANRTAGWPTGYYIIGQTLTVISSTDTDIELTYYQSIPPLTDANPTNWLLAKSPNLYLRGGQMQAAEFIKDINQASAIKMIVDGYLSSLNGQSDVETYPHGTLQLEGLPQ